MFSWLGVAFWVFLGHIYQDKGASVNESLLEIHRALLEQRRFTMNLVGPGDVSEHYEDCQQALGWLDASMLLAGGAGDEPRRLPLWADLGSGAGFPGMVFAALFEAVQLELVDSRLKRCLFMEEVLAQAGTTNVQLRRQRVETLPQQAYDGVMARAFAAPQQVLTIAEGLLKPLGMVVLFLQAEAEIPEHQAFEWLHTQPYVVAGKHRKSVGLRRLATLPG